MIKPNELRIGNIIGWRTGFGALVTGPVYEVHRDKVAIGPETAIDINSSGQGFMKIRGVEPIPVTAAWLERFGGEKLEASPFYEIDIGRNIGQIHINPVNGMIWLRHHRNEATLINPDSGDTYYVHQLQNLFFSLAGEELKLRD